MLRLPASLSHKYIILLVILNLKSVGGDNPPTDLFAHIIVYYTQIRPVHSNIQDLWCDLS